MGMPIKVKFCANEELEVYISGRLTHKGVPGKKEGEQGYSPYINFAVALMQHHGDWPKDPQEGQEVTLQ